MISDQLKPGEYSNFYKNYIDKSTSLDIVDGLKENLISVQSFYSSLPQEKHDFAYAEGKWTIKDVLLHVIDSERIFAYRALRLGRQDKTPLMGFEQDDYIVSANANNRSFSSILEEYTFVRQSSIALFESFDLTALKQIGEASGFPVSVRALGYILTGHENHHIQIIKERYLN
jgi:hypothetical protein